LDFFLMLYLCKLPFLAGHSKQRQRKRKIYEVEQEQFTNFVERLRNLTKIKK